MDISVLGFLTGSEDICSGISTSNCFFYIVFSLGKLSFACLPIILIGETVWSAFKKKKHWIPAGSLVVGALVLQFLPLLNKSFNFPDNNLSDHQQDKERKELFKSLGPYYLSMNETEFEVLQENVDRIYTKRIFYYNWVSVVCGRVSMFVLLGCLLPGVKRPLSTNLWKDMAALIINCSLALFYISYETLVISKLDIRAHFKPYLVNMLNITMAVALVILVLLLVSAALAGASISKTLSHKIPTIFLVKNFNSQFVWENVEERASQSLFVARTADPQYIVARSVLTSSIAFVITICNGILIFEIWRFTVKLDRAETFFDIWFVLRCVVIVMGSFIIYWRCITAVVFYPKRLGWKLSSLEDFFHIENFWKKHLLGIIDSFNTNEESGDRSLGKLMMKVCSMTRLHKLLYLLHYLQVFSVLLSKICWLPAHLLFSNKYLAKLLMGSAYDEFTNLSRSKNQRVILLGKGSEYDKYLKSLVVMQGENSAGVWIANRKSIQEIKEQMKKGEEEGKICNELISFLKDNSSPDFGAERCVRLQIGLLARMELERELDEERELDVESELNVQKCSWKMTAVSIIAVIIELSSFIQNQVVADNMVDSVMESCSQAWDIMDIIEISDGEEVELSKTANILFQSLHKAHKWFDCHLPTSKSPERTPVAVKKAMESLFEKGKIISNDYESRKWSETVAGYSLYTLGVHINYRSTSVDVILKKLHGMLADVIGSCSVKAVGVIMEDCKKQASLYDEENILKIARVAGKVKGLTENLGWKLKWSVDEETQSIKTILAREEVPAIIKYATFHMG